MKTQMIAACAGCAALMLTACRSSPEGGPFSINLGNETQMKPVVAMSVRNGVSRPLRAITSSRPQAVEPPVLTNPPEEVEEDESDSAGFVDPVLQRTAGAAAMPAPIVNAAGVGILTGPLPPDTNGDVGPNHYFQYVNGFISVYDKAGTRLATPIFPMDLFAGFGGVCETVRGTDGVILYDQLADRWVLMRLVDVPADFHICFAVSQTPDPLGAFFLYDFLYSTTKLPDYPKLGVWPDGYYLSANLIQRPSGLNGGGGATVFERDQMLAGNPAQSVQFDLFSANPAFRGFLPSDLDGPPPPLGAPNYYAGVFRATPNDVLLLWQLHVDWQAPDVSTMGLAGQPNSSLPVASYLRISCSSRQCIPRPAPGPALDNTSQLMFRLQYRNFGDHESLVATHTVDAGFNRAGIRWYELRDPGGAPAIFQQGTFAPDDGEHRWTGSIAMDGRGDIAVGYSVSSAQTFPAIRYAGRLVDDPPGVLARSEASLVEGAGVQTSPTSRWGDYSMMAVDPADDCTFWYTQEYYTATSDHQWRTRIGSFRFPSCGSAEP